MLLLALLEDEKWSDDGKLAAVIEGSKVQRVVQAVLERDGSLVLGTMDDTQIEFQISVPDESGHRWATWSEEDVSLRIPDALVSLLNES